MYKYIYIMKIDQKYIDVFKLGSVIDLSSLENTETNNEIIIKNNYIIKLPYFINKFVNNKEAYGICFINNTDYWEIIVCCINPTLMLCDANIKNIEIDRIQQDILNNIQDLYKLKNYKFYNYNIEHILFLLNTNQFQLYLFHIIADYLKKNIMIFENEYNIIYFSDEIYTDNIILWKEIDNIGCAINPYSNINLPFKRSISLQDIDKYNKTLKKKSKKEVENEAISYNINIIGKNKTVLINNIINIKKYVSHIYNIRHISQM